MLCVLIHWSMKNLAFHSYYSYEGWLILPILTKSLIHFFLRGWENVLFELGSERVKSSSNWHMSFVVLCHLRKHNESFLLLWNGIFALGSSPHCVQRAQRSSCRSGCPALAVLCSLVWTLPRPEGKDVHTGGRGGHSMPLSSKVLQNYMHLWASRLHAVKNKKERSTEEKQIKQPQTLYKPGTNNPIREKVNILLVRNQEQSLCWG